MPSLVPGLQRLAGDKGAGLPVEEVLTVINYILAFHILSLLSDPLVSWAMWYVSVGRSKESDCTLMISFEEGVANTVKKE